MNAKSKSTIIDVAEKAGVSTATVSRLINGIGPISEATDERVRAAIKALNYSPRRKRRPHAERGETGRGNGASAPRPITFLRITPPEGQDRHPVTESLIDSLHRYASAMGCNLTVHHIRNLDAVEARQLIGDAQGALIFSKSNESDLLQKLHKWIGHTPAVQVLGVNRSSRLLFDHVGPDNIQVGVQAVDYLVGFGCTQLVFAAPGLHCGVGLARCAAFARAACEAGKPVHVFAQSDEAGAREIREELGGLPVDCQISDDRLGMIKKIAALQGEKVGLFVPTDLELAMLMPQLQMMGVDFVKNAQVIGCDRETRCLSGLDPMPATMDLHLEHIAMRAIRRLILRMENKDEPLVRISVAPSLVLPDHIMDPVKEIDAVDLRDSTAF